MRYVLFVLFAATASGGQVVEIDGEQFEVAFRSASDDAVSVKVVPYSAKQGDDSRGLVTGYIISHLPSKHYKVNLAITFWEISGGVVSVRPHCIATVCIDNPVPGKPTKFKTAVERGFYSTQTTMRYIHSASVTIERLPAKVGTP